MECKNSISVQKADALPATALAFVGDAVFTLFVRTRLTVRYDFKAGELTRRAAMIVSAVNQSKILDKLEAFLTVDEMAIVKRCRNAHTNNSAKNASIGEYRRATGLEGLLGYLYLTDDQRLDEILNKCMEGDN